jgi:hypothetical protein
MFEKVFNRHNQVKKTRELFIANFFSDQRHEWIKEDKYLVANLEELFDMIPSRFLQKLIKSYPIVLVQSSGRFSCAIGGMKEHVIVIFPEVVQGLRSTNAREAQAIIAHEIGHILNGHFDIHVDPIDAQIQADVFAAELGFLDEIESILLDQPESVEKRVRLSQLTARYFDAEA